MGASTPGPDGPWELLSADEARDVNLARLQRAIEIVTHDPVWLTRGESIGGPGLSFVGAVREIYFALGRGEERLHAAKSIT